MPEEDEKKDLENEDEEDTTKAVSMYNINVDAAFIHAIGDLCLSLGVCISATIIYYNPTYTIADPICTFIFSIIVCTTAFPVLKSCTLVLMEKTPQEIDVDQLLENLKNVKGVQIKSIRDFHLWQISVGKFAFTAHIDCEEPKLALKKCTNLLRKKYDIKYVTLQIEDYSK